MPDDLSGRLTFRTDLSKVLAEVAAGTARSEDLTRAASAAGELPGGLVVGDVVWSIAEILYCLALAVQWEPAIANADPNPLRFRDAARHRADKVVAARGVNRWPPQLQAAVAGLSQLAAPGEIKGIAENLSATPIPARITAVTQPKPPPSQRQSSNHGEVAPQPSPILVLLSLDDQPIQSPLVVQPQYIYRMGVAVRVDAWPAGATAIALEFVSVLPRTMLDLQPVRIERGATTAITHLQVRGTLQLGASEEIVLRASYCTEGDGATRVSIVGNPRFKIATFDPATALPRNLPMVAQKHLEMLHELDAKAPNLLRADRDDFFTLFESLLRFAHRAIHDRRLAAQPRIPEAAFQSELRAHLHADPGIGARHWEAPRLASGIADLGLGNIVLELKVEHDRIVTMDRSVDFMSQPAHYAADVDRAVSILCILDDSEKESPPGSLANYMGWLVPSLHGLNDPRFPSLVAVVIVPIRFPRPSEWSA